MGNIQYKAYFAGVMAPYYSVYNVFFARGKGFSRFGWFFSDLFCYFRGGNRRLQIFGRRFFAAAVAEKGSGLLYQFKQLVRGCIAAYNGCGAAFFGFVETAVAVGVFHKYNFKVRKFGFQAAAHYLMCQSGQVGV